MFLAVRPVEQPLGGHGREAQPAQENTGDPRQPGRWTLDWRLLLRSERKDTESSGMAGQAIPTACHRGRPPLTINALRPSERSPGGQVTPEYALRVRTGVLVCCGVVLGVLAGCGGSTHRTTATCPKPAGPTISTIAALRVLECVGFTGLRVLRHVEVDTGVTGQIDEVSPKPQAGHAFTTVDIQDYHSRRGYSPSAVLGASYVRLWLHNLPPRFLPRHFHSSSKKAFSVRVCNVFLSSYNARNDPHLPARLHRAERLLRADCRARA